jgi:hypothetical protein
LKKSQDTSKNANIITPNKILSKKSSEKSTPDQEAIKKDRDFGVNRKIDSTIKSEKAEPKSPKIVKPTSK